MHSSILWKAVSYKDMDFIKSALFCQEVEVPVYLMAQASEKRKW